MKATALCISVFVAVALAQGARAGEGDVPPPLRLELDLVDGSRIIGTPAIGSVPLQTSYAKMDLPLAQITAIRFGDDHETASVDLRNGDRLKGVLSLRALGVEALFGAVEVPLVECRRIVVLGGGADAGLMLHYTFDEDSEKVRDQSGRGHDGYWVGGPVYEAGVKGKAARFRSKDTYVVAPAPELTMNGWAGMTVSLWVSTPGHTLYGHVINRGPLATDQPGAFELAIGHGYGKGVFAVRNASTNPCPTVAAGPGNLPLNQWCHLAGTYDGEVMRYYIDGKLEKETRLAASPSPLADGPDTKLVIGNMSRLPFINWTDMFFNGWVDEVRLYDRALCGDEIKQLRVVDHRGGGE